MCSCPMPGVSCEVADTGELFHDKSDPLHSHSVRLIDYTLPTTDRLKQKMMFSKGDISFISESIFRFQCSFLRGALPL